MAIISEHYELWWAPGSSGGADRPWCRLNDESGAPWKKTLVRNARSTNGNTCVEVMLDLENAQGMYGADNVQLRVVTSIDVTVSWSKYAEKRP